MSSGSFSSPVFYARMPDWQKVLIALIVSILVNLAFFAIIGLSIMLRDDTGSKSLDKLKLVEVAVATPTPKPVEILPLQPVSTPTPLIESDDLHKTDNVSRKPLFESDQNLVAGSTQPAKGDVPLPSQEGKDRDELDFSTHKHVPGHRRWKHGSSPGNGICPGA